jgi:glycosyltransferase involved in cell wall biosynthesis
MRIGIDARFYGPIGKGLGRYTQKLIENLEKVDDKNQYFIFLKSENFSQYEPKTRNFKKVLADYHWYTLEEQIKLPRLLGKYRLDLMHFPHFNVPIFYFGRFVVTIHDLILLHFPTERSSTLSPLLYRLKFLMYKIVISSAIRRSCRIIAVSRFTKKDILDNYRYIPNEKVKITYEACDDYCALSPNKDDEILKKYGIIKPYLLYVGNAYPHKNLERLTIAFLKVKEKLPDTKLVLVGKMDYFYKRLRREVVLKKNIKGVIFLGYVADHELGTIYHNANLYVFPSLYEGFGLPPLEAMANGTPVISSDHACMKEILGESARYFDAKNVDDIARNILEVSIDKDVRRNLVERGYRRIGSYSWKKMARETLEIYNSIKK